jgi:hypothetical protein
MHHVSPFCGTPAAGCTTATTARTARSLVRPPAHPLRSPPTMKTLAHEDDDAGHVGHFERVLEELRNPRAQEALQVRRELLARLLDLHMSWQVVHALDAPSHGGVFAHKVDEQLQLRALLLVDHACGAGTSIPPRTRWRAWSGGAKMCTATPSSDFRRVFSPRQFHPCCGSVCVLLLQDLLQSCSRGGGGEWRTCATKDDEPRPVSAHHALVNAGDKEIV